MLNPLGFADNAPSPLPLNTLIKIDKVVVVEVYHYVWGVVGLCPTDFFFVLLPSNFHVPPPQGIGLMVRKLVHHLCIHLVILCFNYLLNKKFVFGTR